MKRIDAFLADYDAHHRSRGNVACHVAGITLILFGVLSMLSAIRVGALGRSALTAADLAVAAIFAFDLSLDARLALAMLIELAALNALARAFGNWRVGLAAFVVGWVFQGVGHAVYEKNKPAFFKNLVHLLVGPLFLLNELLHLRPAGAQVK